MEYTCSIIVCSMQFGKLLFGYLIVFRVVQVRVTGLGASYGDGVNDIGVAWCVGTIIKEGFGLLIMYAWNTADFLLFYFLIGM